MKSKKEPQTELEYWRTIDTLSEIIWRMNHVLGRDRNEDCREIKTSISKLSQELERFVFELDEKFGVIYPKNVNPHEKIPEAKIRYRNWCEKMNKIAHEEDYGKMICSVCPFSKGVEEMYKNVSCGVVRERAWLSNPYTCGMLRIWSEKELHENIQKK